MLAGRPSPLDVPAALPSDALTSPGAVSPADGSGSGSGKKKKKSTKGDKRPSSAPRPVDLPLLGPRDRALQVELFKLAEGMGVRTPPPPPAPLLPVPAAPSASDDKPKTGSMKSPSSLSTRSGAGSRAAAAKPLAPTMFSIAQVGHVKPAECTCATRTIASSTAAREASFGLSAAMSYAPQKCAVHKQFESEPSRVQQPLFQSWTVTAAQTRLSAHITSSVEDVVAEGPRTVTSRLDLHAMIERYTEALEKLHPWGMEVCEVFSRRAALFLALGMHDAAIEDCIACLEIDDTYSAGRFQLGLALFGVNRFEDAHRVFAEGLRQCPGNSSMRRGVEACSHELQKLCVLDPTPLTPASASPAAAAAAKHASAQPLPAVRAGGGTQPPRPARV